MTSFRKAYHLKQRISKTMLKKRGIHGVGVGLKEPGKPGKGAAVIVYATPAAATAGMRKPKTTHTRQPLPTIAKKISGVPVRVVRSKGFKKNSSSGNFTKHIRPVIAGYSIGRPEESGTAGLIVSTDPQGLDQYILSNNHVLVNNNSSRTSVTIQPGGADGGTTKKDLVGYMSKFVKLHKKKNNYIDAAITKPLSRNLVKPRYAVYGNVPGHITSYKVGDQFKKVGRTSGVVTGTVESIHTDIQVNYGDYGNLGTITFKNQSIIRGKGPVSLPGTLAPSGSRKKVIKPLPSISQAQITAFYPSLTPLTGS
ncbi:hypothetical protein RE628_15480 [Paenibacillus sp. D2_2]|uniref:hypothetical protein n=1 Tax=Paenibacillus sp. D2_2 TaxID=3073092 RepID=UPI002815A1FF|nr:hypothetical protein [Paenibacillus sp. D2_2]WMT38932.1 hypothetical protein RE628_15480 [Paenibacillus sp. D2_2]